MPPLLNGSERYFEEPMDNLERRKPHQLIEDGYNARKRGVSQDSNPCHLREDFYWWNDGWECADAEILESNPVVLIKEKAQ